MQTLVNLFKTVACPVYIYDYISRHFSFKLSTTGNITSVTTSFYAYDADGIIAACTDTTTGTINTAHVEFQGKAANRLSFDTPCSGEQDTSITAHITIKTHPGILYYGYRFYSPDLGRWLSRDPIGEEGGNHLLCFVYNNPINFVDTIGLSKWDCCDECNSNDEPRITDINYTLKWIFDDRSPAKDVLARRMLSNVTRLALFQSAGGIAASATTASALLAVVDSAFGEARTAGWTQKIESAINEIKTNAMENYGAAIWVMVEWEKCEKHRCFPKMWRRYYDWRKHSGWKKCSTKGDMITEGFDLNNPSGIYKALPSCFREAVNELVK